MQECWVREAAEEEGWNQLESRQPPIPPVRVSEVSGGERRDSRRGFRASSSPRPAPRGGGALRPQTLELRRSSLPSLRVCLVGWARVCPLGKPVGPGPVYCPSDLHWGRWAYSPPWEGPRAGLVVRTGEHVGVTGTLCVLAPVTCPPGHPTLFPELIFSLHFCHWTSWSKLCPL